MTGLIAGLRPWEMIVKYKCPNQIRQEENELSNWMAAELAQSDSVNELAKAMLDDSPNTLRKLTSPIASDAKALAADVRAKHGVQLRKSNPNLSETAITEILKNLLPAHRLAAIVTEFNRRSDVLEKEKRRTRPFVEAWNSLPPYGPWSVVH